MYTLTLQTLKNKKNENYILSWFSPISEKVSLRYVLMFRPFVNSLQNDINTKMALGALAEKYWQEKTTGSSSVSVEVKILEFLYILYSSTFVQFHICTVPSLYSSTFVQFHICTVPYLYSSIFVQFRICIVPRLYSSIFVQFHICTVPHFYSSTFV